MKRWQKFSLIVLTTVSLLFAVSFLFAAAYQICTPANDGTAEQCVQYHLGPFVVFWIIRVLDSHNGLVTAIATVFVAGFTWTLWRSNEATIAQAKATSELAEKQFLMEGQQADLAAKQHGLARLQFLALNRPRIEIRSVGLAASGTGGQLLHTGFPIKGSLVVVNTGASDATIREGEYRFYWTRTGLPMVPPINKPGQTKPILADLPHTMAAHESCEVKIESESALAPEATEILLSGYYELFVMGAIRYSDGDLKERWMGFCRQYVRPPSVDGEGSFLPVKHPDYEYSD
jgi:hypothetical protein